MHASSREEMDYRIDQAKEGVAAAMAYVEGSYVTPDELTRVLEHVFKAIQEVADHAATRD